MTFDVVVIGKGLIGCAAAKYLCRSNVSVAVIGPNEPENFSEAQVFASHYDSGRILRQLAENTAITQLNIHALNEYPILRDQSGIEFQGKKGCLYVNPLGTDSYLDTAQARAKAHNFGITLHDNVNSLAADLPYFNFPESAKGVLETAPSGYINPRELIRAQLKVVQLNNGAIINEVVNKVKEEDVGFTVKTAIGGVYKCEKVIFTMGAFTNHYDLLDQNLEISLKSETVILAEIDSEEKERLNHMPSLLFEIDTPEIEGVYATPPIKYPDGNFYIKLGANLPSDISFDTNKGEIKEWFANGDSNANIPILEKTLLDVMPDLKVKNVYSKRCILTRTRSDGNPYICQLDEGGSYLAVGNGWSGGNSDGVGYVVSELALNEKFPAGFSREDFKSRMV